jgi:hypothetical protein
MHIIKNDQAGKKYRYSANRNMKGWTVAIYTTNTLLSKKTRLELNILMYHLRSVPKSLLINALLHMFLIKGKTTVLLQKNKHYSKF